MRELNGVGIFIANVENKERLQKVFKTRLGELACQCRFMAFWVCLLQIVTCPFISKAIQHSFTDFAVCLLCNFSSVYVHHIIVEQSALNQSVKSADRGSSDNITRLKIYFTLEDAHPMLVRFDLSHKGVPYLHINVEDENGDKEIQEYKIDDLLMRKKKPQGCQGCSKGCNNKNQGCNKGHGKRKN